MKKLFAVLLSLAMLLSLAACGTSDEGGEPTIIGTWEGTMDMGALLSAATQMEFDAPLEAVMRFTFNEDGTYSLVLDEDSLKDMMDDLVDVVIQMMIEMSDDPNMDLEAELAKEGMTMEEFREQIAASMNLDEMMGNTETKGYYKFENGKLYTADEKEDLDNVEEISCSYVTLTRKTLTITEIEQDGEKSSEVMPDMFPMVFNKK